MGQGGSAPGDDENSACLGPEASEGAGPRLPREGAAQCQVRVQVLTFEPRLLGGRGGWTSLCSEPAVVLPSQEQGCLTGFESQDS